MRLIVQEFQQETELFWNSSMLLLTYSQTVLFLLREESSKEALEPYWHNIHLPQYIFHAQSETIAYFCYH